jgi:hypothetical protein
VNTVVNLYLSFKLGNLTMSAIINLSGINGLRILLIYFIVERFTCRLTSPSIQICD